MARTPGRLRARSIAVILLAVALAALGVGVLVIDRTGEAVLAARQRAVAASARDYFVAIAHEEGLAPLARALDRRERVGAGREAFRYALYANDGRVMGGARILPADRLPAPGGSRAMLTVAGETGPWQVLVQPLATGGTLVVYEDLADRSAFRAALAVGAGGALLAALAAVLAASLWLSRRIYRRAEVIEAAAARIAAGDFSARAPSEPGGDAFDRLGGRVNVMLDRTEALLTGLRTATDSLAHDLRSPLTRMKGALMRAQGAGDEATRDEAIGQALEEADRALATTSALLDIARAEAGLSRDAFQAVDLEALVAEVAELFGPVVEDAGQTFQVALPEDGAVVLPGHELLLRQAVGNLIYNAAQYAGEGAAVSVAVERAGAGARIVVADTGPGVAQADLARVTERFVRGDAARTRPGSGLGLAIATACAKLHGGELTLEDNGPGLRVTLSLTAEG